MRPALTASVTSRVYASTPSGATPLSARSFGPVTEITRTVEEIPGGVRTITQSNAPDLTAKLHAHVSACTPMLTRAPKSCV
uniref:Uncharacterized protein n=1 Tax=Mycobacterium riyadhense TaxID=486698 RepID=A0A653F664_9MYCO|nr:hypothetical protein BIN_B_05558 [Mycobacterium riyadhense]